MSVLRSRKWLFVKAAVFSQRGVTMKTVIIHKNSIGGILDEAVVNEDVGTEKTLSDLLMTDWTLDIGDTITIEAR